MKNYLTILLIVLVAFNLAFSVFNYLSKEQAKEIKYVRSPDLIYGYIGTKEVQNIFSEKQLLEEARIDSLENEYNKLAQQIQSVYKTLSKEEQAQQQVVLQQKEEEVYRFTQAIEQKMSDEEERLMQGVLNQINAFIKEYGEQNDIDIIFGSNTNGNILYGKTQSDITDEILTQLNNNYRPKG